MNLQFKVFLFVMFSILIALGLFIVMDIIVVYFKLNYIMESIINLIYVIFAWGIPYWVFGKVFTY